MSDAFAGMEYAGRTIGCGCFFTALIFFILGLAIAEFMGKLF